MSNNHSFTITLSNNITEKEGVKFLINNYSGFFQIDLNIKKNILDLLKIDYKFLQAFDLIYIPNMVNKEVFTKDIETCIDDIILVELKTTKKYLPENPKGFFFGATENEFKFAALLGEKYRFCFVSLNEKGCSFSFLDI